MKRSVSIKEAKLNVDLAIVLDMVFFVLSALLHGEKLYDLTIIVGTNDGAENGDFKSISDAIACAVVCGVNVVLLCRTPSSFYYQLDREYENFKILNILTATEPESEEEAEEEAEEDLEEAEKHSQLDVDAECFVHFVPFVEEEETKCSFDDPFGDQMTTCSFGSFTNSKIYSLGGGLPEQSMMMCSFEDPFAVQQGPNGILYCLMPNPFFGQYPSEFPDFSDK